MAAAIVFVVATATTVAAEAAAAAAAAAAGEPAMARVQLAIHHLHFSSSTAEALRTKPRTYMV